MKKKIRKPRASSKKKVVTKRKSYYKPKKSKKVVKKTVTKKKYKSYYKPKKKVLPTTNTTELVGTQVITPPPVEVAATAPKRPVKYLNNKDLLAEVIKSKGQVKMTGDLAKMLQLLTSRYAKKGNFANYTYNDDMQSYAMLMLVKTWNSFDPAKSSNPFAFFTQCIKNSFIQYLNYEKRQRDIRDEVLVDQGLSPSYNYQHEYSEDLKSAAEPLAENENVELPSKPSHNIDLFEVDTEETLDEVPSSDTLTY